MRPWHWCLVAAATLSVAGCGSAAEPAATPTTAPSTAAPTTSAPTTSAPPTTAAPTTSPPTTSPPTTDAPTTSPPPTASDQDCTTTQLSASVSAGNGAAGTVYYQLELHNTSDVTCLEVGWPGVSLVAGNGTQIGAAAVRVRHPMAPLTVEPGHVVYATLGVADAANYPADTCHPARAAGVRVYPPNQKAALVVPFKAEGCLNKTVELLRIAPLTPAPPG
jgi:hypothetical protein